MVSALIERESSDDTCVVFKISETGMDHFADTLLLQLCNYGFRFRGDIILTGSSVDSGVLSKHIAVAGDPRNVDGKKEYSLYYGNNPVAAKIYMVHSDSRQRWKPSDLKWYMVSSKP